MSAATRARMDAADELSDIATLLDVPQSLYQDAQGRYDAVCRWLGDDEKLSEYAPIMYPQGSFALGTVIRPPDEMHYDVDAVCLLQATSAELTQRELKQLVGDRLKAHEVYAEMLQPPSGGRRCWTLNYAESARFHLDILPAIPGDEDALVAIGVDRAFAKHAIQITDSTSWDSGAGWPRSNPKGYAEWFKGQMRIRLDELRKSAAARLDASIESVPEYEIRTPLQQMIQLFKKHRDNRFGNDDDRPISIIITTLAAEAYRNEANLADAITNAVPEMRRLITRKGEEYWVPNPVNPHENFADKWKETPRKATLFFEWLEAIEREHETLLTTSLIEKRADALGASYGVRPSRTRSAPGTGLALGPIHAASSMELGFHPPHREAPPWQMSNRFTVSLAVTGTRDGFRGKQLRNGDDIGRGWSVRFEATSNAPMGAQFHWQVVNTGKAAKAAKGLRGEIFKGQRSLLESTLYPGMHWVEVFVVQDGNCVARSGEFVVSIGAGR